MSPVSVFYIKQLQLTAFPEQSSRKMQYRFQTSVMKDWDHGSIAKASWQVSGMSENTESFLTSLTVCAMTYA